MLMQRTFYLLAVGFLLSSLFVLAGCGGSRRGAKLSGSLVYNGKPMKVADKEEVNITFFPDMDATDLVITTASYHPDTGTFEVEGPGKAGVPPGKYRVAVTSAVYGEDVDRFDSSFSDENTPLSYEVTSDPQQKLVIELGQSPAVTRQP